MDQQESIVQPMNQWGNKEGHQVIQQELQYIEFFPYDFIITTWKVAKTTAHQRLIFKVQKLAEALIQTQNYTFFSKYLNSIT